MDRRSFLWTAPAFAMTGPLMGEEVADRILVLKRRHEMQLLRAGKTLRRYSIALGRGGLAPQSREGDGCTPEGLYRIDARNKASHFHCALHISYPNTRDKESAQRRGVSPGGNVLIHGLGNGFGWLGAQHRRWDWTEGCIAVTNAEIEEIWNLVPVGTPIEIEA